MKQLLYESIEKLLKQLQAMYLCGLLLCESVEKTYKAITKLCIYVV